MGVGVVRVVVRGRERVELEEELMVLLPKWRNFSLKPSLKGTMALKGFPPWNRKRSVVMRSRWLLEVDIVGFLCCSLYLEVGKGVVVGVVKERILEVVVVEEVR